VDPAKLRLADPRGRITGTVPSSNNTVGTLQNVRPRTELPTPKPGGAVPNEASQARSYTDLSKESVGLTLVRNVLASDATEMVDLRAQHGVGADAVDTLDRFFELKVYAGPEPDRITLEEPEIRRALSTPDFFLVVVSGVEAANPPPQVRFIVDPLKQLKMTETSSLSFSGVRESRSVVYEFVPD
jgi:hypothetical protein